MAGLLRKLAGLVVEFPDEDKGSGGAAAKGGSDKVETDPLAAIEAIRADLESSSTLDPGRLEAEAAASGDAGDALSAPPGVAGSDNGEPAAGPALPGQATIRLPIVLNIKQVYEKAELPAVPGGFDLEKVNAMLSDAEIADLPLDVRARSVKMAIKSAGGELKEVLADAARRDQALEVYQDYLARRVQEVETQVLQQNAQLEQEIQDFIAARRAIIESNKSKLEAAQQAQHRYLEAKQGEEQRLFETVAPFVAAGENPVIVSGSAKPRPDHK